MTYTEERARHELKVRGYKEIAECRGLKAGERIRHVGDQYPEAYDKGTANVLAVFERVGSYWSQSYGDRDIELIVLSERGEQEPYVTLWADYHCFRLAVSASTTGSEQP